MSRNRSASKHIGCSAAMPGRSSAAIGRRAVRSRSSTSTSPTHLPTQDRGSFELWPRVLSLVQDRDAGVALEVGVREAGPDQLPPVCHELRDPRRRDRNSKMLPLGMGTDDTVIGRAEFTLCHP